MLNTITNFPKSANKALETIEQINFKINGAEYDSILVAGMGGSAVGGLLLRDWLYDSLRIPITVNRGYHLPTWVDEKTLVYAVSYSGNTEETTASTMRLLKKDVPSSVSVLVGCLRRKPRKNSKSW